MLLVHVAVGSGLHNLRVPVLCAELKWCENHAPAALYRPGLEEDTQVISATYNVSCTSNDVGVL